MRLIASRIGWVAGTVLAALIAHLALVTVLEGTLRDDIDTENVSIRIDTSDRDADPFGSLMHLLALELGSDRLDLPTLRAHLIDKRLDLNIDVASRIFTSRGLWLIRIEQALKLAGSLLVLTILGPVLLLRRLPPGPDRARVVTRSIPYFVLTAAVTLLLFDFMVGSLAAIQRLQALGLAAGHPAVASTDAAIHYLIAADDAELTRLLESLFRARAQLDRDPIGALGLVDHLWFGANAVRESALLNDAWQLTHSAAAVLEGYVGLLIIATLALVATLVGPVVRRLVTYPFDVASGQADPRIRRFALAQLTTFWRELRITLWTVAFVLVFMALVVIAVRALCFPVVIVAIKTLLALERQLDQGVPLPAGLILADVISLALFLVLASTLLFAPAAIVLSKAHIVVRARTYGRQRFRDSRAFGSVIRDLHWRVVTPTLGGIVAVLGLYFAAVAVVPAPELRLWIVAPLLAPGLALVVWRARAFPWLVRLARVDPLEGRR